MPFHQGFVLLLHRGQLSQVFHVVGQELGLPIVIASHRRPGMVISCEIHPSFVIEHSVSSTQVIIYWIRRGDGNENLTRLIE